MPEPGTRLSKKFVLSLAACVSCRYVHVWQLFVANGSFSICVRERGYRIGQDGGR